MLVLLKKNREMLLSSILNFKMCKSIHPGLLGSFIFHLHLDPQSIYVIHDSVLPFPKLSFEQI